MSSGLPLSESRQLLGDGMEETDDDTDGSGLHIVAELVDGSGVWNTVTRIELHLFPDSQENGGEHEDRGPVLEPITTVHAGVQG